jgi:hypothetical protein
MHRLLPWWILLAPIVLALIDLARTPKVRRRNAADTTSR